MSTSHSPSVFTQTNDAAGNAVTAFTRAEGGALSPGGTFVTDGLGSGSPHLPSQGSVVAAAAHLLVVNAGSDDVSAFAVGGGGLTLVDRTPSGGVGPRSIAVDGDLVYVLNAGGDGPGGVSGFRLGADGRLQPIPGSARPLSSNDADGAQAAFDPSGRTLVVTERVTDRISTYAVREDGSLDGPTSQTSSGATPYGFDFSRDGVLVVTEAFGGRVGAAAASSYRVNGRPGVVPLSASVPNTRSEVCWAVVGKDGRHAWVTNFGDGTVSSYAIAPDGSLSLLDAVAATTHLGVKGLRDAALSRDGAFLYALDADARQIFAWVVGDDGRLGPVGAVDGLPETAAGLAAL